MLAHHYGGSNDVLWQASVIFSAKPERWLKDREWIEVYLSRYARIPPSEQEGKTSRKLLAWCRQTSDFLKQESDQNRMVGDGEDG